MYEKTPCIYIMTNKKHGTLYVGVTSNLCNRVIQHKNSQVKGFTQRYNLYKLVYYEQCPSMGAAIVREKQLKAGSRKRKVDCIESINPEWCDLYGMGCLR